MHRSPEDSTGGLRNNKKTEESTEKKDAAQENTENTPASEWTDPPVDTLLRINAELEKYEDENWEIREIPELFGLDGKLNKDLFAGLVMYKAPQYLLYGTEGAREAIDFLEKLDARLQDEELANTIVFLKEQLPYLDEAMVISDKAFDELNIVLEKASRGKHWFDDMKEKADASLAGSKANLLRAKVEIAVTEMINKTYEGLWKKYLVEGYTKESIRALPTNEENNSEWMKSPIKEAYSLLNAHTPLELNNFYTAEDQKLFKSGSWDYANPELVINKVKTILESASEDGMSDEEKEWRKEILWFWYHHAISCAIFKYKDKEAAKEYSQIALQYKAIDHPNKITDILNLLLDGNISAAEELAQILETDKETALGLIEDYKQGGMI